MRLFAKGIRGMNGGSIRPRGAKGKRGKGDGGLTVFASASTKKVREEKRAKTEGRKIFKTGKGPPALRESNRERNKKRKGSTSTAARQSVASCAIVGDQHRKKFG